MKGVMARLALVDADVVDVDQSEGEGVGEGGGMRADLAPRARRALPCREDPPAEEEYVRYVRPRTETPHC